MTTKSLPLRLDPALHDELREVAAATGSTMVELVREALADYLPRVARRRAREMETRLARLRAIAGEPLAMEAAIRATAEAEAEHADLLEREATVRDASPAPHAPLTSRVRKSLG